MTLTLDRHAPSRALRTAVFGCLAGTALGGLFVAAVLLFDIGHVASLTRTNGLPFGDLGLLLSTFGLLGLVVAPALRSAAGETAD